MLEETLLDLGYDRLTAWLKKHGEPAYRAKQIWTALYCDLVETPNEMTTLPLTLRGSLAESFAPWQEAIVDEQRSADRRTLKALLRLQDGQTIESVLMRYADRQTVCVSTQVGCAMGCAFCATGRSGFVRDLASGEIIAQVLWAARAAKRRGARLTNVVYMGMGEPFANYEATIASLRRLNDPRGFGLGARSFTVSTVGLVPGIDRFADEPLQANLAVSLHSADDETRRRLIPSGETYPVSEILDACRRYIAKTNRRVTFEVALIDGVNDSLQDAETLARRLRGLLCHVNVIPLNPSPGIGWRPSLPQAVEPFAEHLNKAGIPTTVRRSMGAEIRAGCGQLRGRTR